VSKVHHQPVIAAVHDERQDNQGDPAPAATGKRRTYPASTQREASAPHHVIFAAGIQ